MQIRQPEQQLLEHNRNLDLGQWPRLHKIRAAASSTELHNDPQIRAVQVRPIIFRYKGRIHIGQDHDLAHDVLDFVLGILDINDLDSDGAACSAAQALVHFAKAAAADAFLLGVERRGVDRRLHFGRHGAEGPVQVVVRKGVVATGVGRREIVRRVECGERGRSVRVRVVRVRPARKACKESGGRRMGWQQRCLCECVQVRRKSAVPRFKWPRAAVSGRNDCSVNAGASGVFDKHGSIARATNPTRGRQARPAVTCKLHRTSATTSYDNKLGKRKKKKRINYSPPR